MNQQIYEASFFWVLLDHISDLLTSLTPLLVLLACIFWVIGYRDNISALALAGSAISFVGRLYDLVFPGLNTAYVDGGPSVIDDNSFNIFFYLYAESTGYFVVAICLVIFFRSKHRNA